MELRQVKGVDWAWKREKEASLMRTRVLLSVLWLVLLGALMLNGQTTSDFLSTHYYILSMGEVAADVGTLGESTKDEGFTVLTYDGEDATVYRGTELASDVSVQDALADDAVLVVDADRFYLRASETAFTYVVRPASDGYELVISPSEDIAIQDTLASLLMSLQEFGVLGESVDLEYTAYAKNDLKGPASPAGASIDSLLYRLMVSEDWHAFAASNSLSMIGLRVDVVAEILPNGVLPEAFLPFAFEQTDQLAELLIPVDLLVTLASSESIGYVRPPYQPAVP